MLQNKVIVSSIMFIFNTYQPRKEKKRLANREQLFELEEMVALADSLKSSDNDLLNRWIPPFINHCNLLSTLHKCPLSQKDTFEPERCLYQATTELAKNMCFFFFFQNQFCSLHLHIFGVTYFVHMLIFMPFWQGFL